MKIWYMTPAHLVIHYINTPGAKIKGFNTAKEMWKVINADTTTKSTLYLLDAEDQLSSMKLNENEDPKAHLMELRLHFQTMIQH